MWTDLDMSINSAARDSSHGLLWMLRCVCRLTYRHYTTLSEGNETLRPHNRGLNLHNSFWKGMKVLALNTLFATWFLVELPLECG